MHFSRKNLLPTLFEHKQKIIENNSPGDNKLSPSNHFWYILWFWNFWNEPIRLHLSATQIPSFETDVNSCELWMWIVSYKITDSFAVPVPKNMSQTESFLKLSSYQILSTLEFLKSFLHVLMTIFVFTSYAFVNISKRSSLNPFPLLRHYSNVILETRETKVKIPYRFLHYNK